MGILRAEGLGRVTLRRVARELDTGHASLYVYIEDTADLHSAILDALIEPIAKMFPPVSAETWRADVIQLLHDYYGVLAAYPQVVQATMTVVKNGQNHMVLLERMLELLDAGGVSTRAAALVVDVLLLYPTALALEHPLSQAQTRAWTPPEDLEAYPVVESLAAPLRAGTPAERFQWTVSLILDGALSADPEGQRTRSDQPQPPRRVSRRSTRH